MRKFFDRNPLVGLAIIAFVGGWIVALAVLEAFIVLTS